MARLSHFTRFVSKAEKEIEIDRVCVWLHRYSWRVLSVRGLQCKGFVKHRTGQLIIYS